jgi:hypothetical protein
VDYQSFMHSEDEALILGRAVIPRTAGRVGINNQRQGLKLARTEVKREKSAGVQTRPFPLCKDRVF